MKAFLEEYGFVILIAIVIILLIVMATPVGNSIKASILGLVDRFSGTATSKLDKADQGDFTVNLRQATGGAATAPVYVDINSDSTTDKYYFTITYVSGGKTHTTKVYDKVSSGTPSLATYSGTPAVPAVSSTIGNTTVTLPTTGLTCTSHTGETSLAIDDGAEVYVTVTNVGTNEVVQSNSIKFHKVG